MMSDAQQYFLDTSFIVALLDAVDVYHAKATQALATIELQPHELFLSDVAVSETLSVFAKRCEAKRQTKRFPDLAKAFQDLMQRLPILSLYELVPQNYKHILQQMIRSESRLSFNDCLIQLFLKQVSQVKILTFDGDLL